MIVLQIIPELKPGGVERSAIEIGTALVQAGHRAIIVAKPGAWSAWAASAGIELIALDLGRKSLWTLRHIRTLRKLLISVAPNVVHTRSRLPSWITWAALRGLTPAQRPIWFTTIHGQHSIKRYSAIQHAGDVVIAVSSSTKQFVQEHYRAAAALDIQVIERGVDRSVYHSADAASLTDSRALDQQFPNIVGKRLLLLPGRGTRLKGHHAALQLLHELADPNLALALLGVIEPDNQNYVAELRALSASLGLSDQVLLLPSQKNLVDWYRRSALVLQLSNRAESFGRTVAEALLCGVPVLGFDIGGVGEQLRRAFPAGLLAMNDQAQLAARARSLLDGPVTIDTQQISSLQDMQQRTLALYQEAITRRSIDRAALTPR
jgi:glycosyltransferase involved in cell wall biosynthesis